jgi:hypothetical protein
VASVRTSDDSSDFELYGANESDNDDKESSADEKKEIEYTEYDVFGSPCDSDGERWYYDSTFCSQTVRPITPSHSPPGSPPPKVISIVSECNSDEEED